jgi:beta-barrel assembly-enhancing protease
MRKIFVQGMTLVLMFFSIWFLFAQVDWVKVFKVHKITSQAEEKLGDLIYDVFRKSNEEINNPIIINTIDSLLNIICKSNFIDRSSIKLRILNNEEVNAFALPHGYLVVYSGLIQEADNQEELSGVISHEIAHISLNHVMKKLVKEIGLSTLLSISTGSSGSEIMMESARILSSTAFDRSMEREADIKAVDYLIKANIDPEPFADFLYKLSEEGGASKYLSWVSTHPEAKERAENIIEYSKNKKVDYKQVISSDTWILLQDEIKVVLIAQAE